MKMNQARKTASNYFKYIEGYNQFNTYYMFYQIFDTRNPGIHQPALIVPNRCFFLFDFQFPLALQHTTTNKYSATHNMLALILILYLKWNSADLTIFHFQWLELQMRQMDKCEKIKRSCVLLLLFRFSLQQCKVSFSSFNRMQIANWKWGHFNCLQTSKVNPEGKATFQYKQIHTQKKEIIAVHCLSVTPRWLLSARILCFYLSTSRWYAIFTNRFRAFNIQLKYYEEMLSRINFFSICTIGFDGEREDSSRSVEVISVLS